MALLSYIIPAWNCQDFIEEAVDSIYIQNIDIPFEVIITNDASTDGTQEVLDRLESMHDNLKVYRHDVNQNISGTRITCMQHARGDLICSLDADNILQEGSVQKLLNAIRDKGCGAASVAEVKFFHGELEYEKSWHYPHVNNMFTLKECISSLEVPPSSGNYLYTRKSYDEAGGYRMKDLHSSWEFGFRQVAVGGAIAIVPETFYYHRLHKDGHFVTQGAEGQLNGSIVSTMKEYMHLFTPKSQKILRSNPPDIVLGKFVPKGKIKLKKPGK